MHEIRKNTVEEFDVLKIKFRYEPIRYVLESLKFLISAGVGIAGIILLLFVKNSGSVGLLIAIVGFIAAVIFLIMMIFSAVGCKKSEVTVSNRRIYGKYGPFLIKKTFSYRLDEIDNVELKDTLGARSIIINFQDGKGPIASKQVYYGNATTPMFGHGVFRLNSVQNWQETYNKLTELLLSLKSNVDLKTDIEMAKVDAENRKVDAIEKVATSLGGSTVASSTSNDSMNYIEEIKKLKELLDAGAITQEEYDTEKKEILDNNHK